MVATTSAPREKGGDLKPTRLIEWAARLGYASRGLVYVLLGGLAVLAASGAGGDTSGKRGVLVTVLMQPLGWIWLSLIALGLASFAAWRLLESVTDADNRGSSFKGIAVRATHFGSGILYLVLSAFAVSLALGWAASGEDGQAAKDWTAWLMSKPFGTWLVMLGGLGFAGAGFGFLWKAWQNKFKKLADRGSMQWLITMGRIGFASRGIVYLLIGSFLVLAGWHNNAQEAEGLGGALNSLQQQPYGWILLGFTALGLVAYGAFGIAEAVYRRIDPPQTFELRP